MESVNVHIIDASFTSLKWKHITWIIKGGLSYFFFMQGSHVRGPLWGRPPAAAHQKDRRKLFLKERWGKTVSLGTCSKPQREENGKESAHGQDTGAPSPGRQSPRVRPSVHNTSGSSEGEGEEQHAQAHAAGNVLAVRHILNTSVRKANFCITDTYTTGEPQEANTRLRMWVGLWEGSGWKAPRDQSLRSKGISPKSVKVKTFKVLENAAEIISPQRSGCSTCPEARGRREARAECPLGGAQCWPCSRTTCSMTRQSVCSARWTCSRPHPPSPPLSSTLLPTLL